MPLAGSQSEREKKDSNCTGQQPPSGKAEGFPPIRYGVLQGPDWAATAQSVSLCDQGIDFKRQRADIPIQRILYLCFPGGPWQARAAVTTIESLTIVLIAASP